MRNRCQHQHRMALKKKQIYGKIFLHRLAMTAWQRKAKAKIAQTQNEQTNKEKTNETNRQNITKQKQTYKNIQEHSKSYT